MLDQGGNVWRFEPEELTVKAGDTVRFIQRDMVPHNVQFTDWPEKAVMDEVEWGPFLTQPDEVYEITIDGRFPPGTYQFVCTPHAPMGMTGSLNVTPGT